MARHLRVEYPGAIYHVTCRMLGGARSRLFIDDADRERFLERLGERVAHYNIRLYMFVLMSNHFHLVFETPECNCSKFMQSLSTAYTIYFNLRHRRHGHLLDGRYKAKLVEGDDYLFSLSRYVHLNPVAIASMKKLPVKERIKYLRSYRWSSYHGYIGGRKGVGWVECGPVLSEVSARNGAKRQGEYRKYVESGLAETDEEFREAYAESPLSIGGDGFRAWVDAVHQQMAGKHRKSEDVSFRRVTEPLASAEVLSVLAEVLDVEVDEFMRRRRKSPLRAVAARFLMRYAALSQRDVADCLGMGTGAAVSKQTMRYGDLLVQDKRWRNVIAETEGILKARKSARAAEQ